MSQHSNQIVKSFAAQRTLTAGLVAAAAGANQASLWLTSTSHILGVVDDTQINSDGAVPIVIGGTARVTCGASVSVGAIVGPASAAANVIERAVPNTVTSQMHKTLGIALQSGSTNASIEVLLQIVNNGARLL